MKHIFKFLCISFMLAVVLGSCDKDENKIYLESATPPVLTSSVADTVPLAFANADKEALRVSWTNPDYQFTTGVSSQGVSYALEIDTAGSNFTNPKRRTLAINNDLTKTFTQGELNDYLLNSLELKPNMAHAIEMRVTASLTAASAPTASNVVSFTATPYAIPPKVAPPESGTLFITGGATPGSWQCACGEAELTSQKFKQVSPTLYVLDKITLTGGESFLFVPVYGSWSVKYGFKGEKNKNNTSGDEIKAGGEDMKAPDATGDYKIEVNFQTGKYTLTKL